MMYLKCLQMVAGGASEFFSLKIFINSLGYCFPFGMILALICTELHILAHHSKLFFLQFVYMAVALISWTVLLPYILNNSNVNTDYVKTDLSSGYFRKMNGNLYYFTSASKKLTYGLKIPLSSKDESNSWAEIITDDIVPSGSYAPFSDPLIKNAVVMPHLLSAVFNGYNFFVYKGVQVARSGEYKNWLSFASMGLPMILIFLLAYSSLWKMINGFLVITIPLGTCVLNILYYSTYMFNFLKKIRYIYPLSAIPDFSIVLCNILISVIVVFSGIILHGVSSERSEIQK